MAKTKVYGIMLSPLQGRTLLRQPRYVVATTSKRKAVELLQAAGHGSLTLHHLNLYGGETGNPTEVATAMAKPDTVFVNVADSEAHPTFEEI